MYTKQHASQKAAFRLQLVLPSLHHSQLAWYLAGSHVKIKLPPLGDQAQASAGKAAKTTLNSHAAASKLPGHHKLSGTAAVLDPASELTSAASAAAAAAHKGKGKGKLGSNVPRPGAPVHHRLAAQRSRQGKMNGAALPVSRLKVHSSSDLLCLCSAHAASPDAGRHAKHATTCN